MVMWDVNAADYKDMNGNLPDPTAIVRRVLKVKPGSIVLMHNGESTVTALPQIIDALVAKIRIRLGYCNGENRLIASAS